ncbi:MAG: NAD(P)-dependent oxidoreductase [Firmicutes bacterium]|nr:NAD(P)-dependent oxidoreductase [Bacillota bacterium]
MKKVIITGASGFIGTALSKQLLQDGVTVYGVGRNENRLNELKNFGDFRPVIADFSDYDKLHEIIDDRDFDMLWHFSWQDANLVTAECNDYNMQLKNIQAACTVAEVAAKLKCAASANLSSTKQYTVELNYAQELLNPMLYGMSKKSAAEWFMTISYKNGVPCKNMLTPRIFGENLPKENPLHLFIRKLLANEELNLISGEFPDDWLYIDDLVDGILHVAKSPKKYTEYYIGNQNITTFKEKLNLMKTVLSSTSNLVFGTYPETHRVDYTKFDLAALQNDTGYVVKSDFAENIRKTADWIKR